MRANEWRIAGEPGLGLCIPRRSFMLSATSPRWRVCPWLLAGVLLVGRVGVPVLHGQEPGKPHALTAGQAERLARLDTARRRQLRDAWAQRRQFMQLHQQGRFKDAIIPAQEEVDLRKRVWGENHRDYAASLNNLARVYEDMGDYAQALPLY